jgi:hypothetical protein
LPAVWARALLKKPISSQNPFYSHYGFNEFIILLGYKGYVIKEYFANYFLHQSDVTFDLANNSMEIHEQHCEPWKFTLIDTGLNTSTAGFHWVNAICMYIYLHVQHGVFWTE